MMYSLGAPGVQGKYMKPSEKLVYETQLMQDLPY